VSGAALIGEGLERRFDQVDAVRGVSIEIAAGESVALQGPSGCGKTTLLQMLGLLDRPDRGRVLLHGVDGYGLSAARRAGQRLTEIGFVFQLHNLLEQLSARDNVALPAWRASGSRRRALRDADQALERFGLTELAGARAVGLSPGQAQRVAVARALINRPSIVLADEPTGSLDTTAAGAVLDALDAVCASGAALLLVTHDPRIAARASRQVTMLDGRLADSGG
jgi:putative ABC transport system ATP-binding protein